MSSQQNIHSIQVLDFISTTEYDQINELMNLCCSHDNINLKLELDYKLHLYHLASKDASKRSSKREFLYYIDDVLVAYLGVSCFDGVTGELCGMTHPLYRGQGSFHRLLALALNECRHSDFKQLLLLADGGSEPGMRFIKTNSHSFAHSEYRMKRLSAAFAPANSDSGQVSDKRVTLRPAEKSDEKNIAHFNAVFFNEEETDEETGEYKTTPLEDQQEKDKTYMIEVNGCSIGKINVEFGEQYAFLCGFGILPEYRGKGYGRKGLTETLRLLEAQGITTIELDVVCTNNNALGLYQSCGFVEQSVMNYYNLI